MTRPLLLLLAGAMVGVASAYWLELVSQRGDETIPRTVVEPELRSAALTVESETAGWSPGYAELRLAVYEQAAQITDAGDIETLIDLAFVEPALWRRDLKLTALLARYAEIDPRRAVEFARARSLEAKFVVPLYEAWARSDSDAAIAALALVTSRALQREIALVILGIIGNDAKGIERVAAMLPTADRISFEIDALMARAESDPTGVIRDLIAMPDDGLRSLMLQRVVAVAARNDPLGALAVAAEIADVAQRVSFRDSLVTSWATVEPEAVYDWLEAADANDLPESLNVYNVLALGDPDPDRLFPILERLPPAPRANAQRVVLFQLSNIDPASAIAWIEKMPPSAERNSLLTAMGEAYGRQNPDLALAWARSLPSAQSEIATANVMRGILSVDSDRAVDVLLAELEVAGPRRATAVSESFASSVVLNTMMSKATGTRPPDFARIAERLVGATDPQARTALSGTLGIWASENPDEAMLWALGHMDRIEPAAFEQMAQQLAQDDPERALGMLGQVPAAQRPGWLLGLAQSVARTDPPRAAAILRETPTGNAQQMQSAYANIARDWIRIDPAAAADWALGLPESDLQHQTLNQIAQGWAERNSGAAARWLRGLESGTRRDSALDGYVAAAGRAGRFDQGLLDLYSTPQAALNGAATAIRAMGASNPEEARRLLDVHIADVEMRRRVAEVMFL